MRMIERFEGDAGRRLLVDALTKQKMVGGNAPVDGPVRRIDHYSGLGQAPSH